MEQRSCLRAEVRIPVAVEASTTDTISCASRDVGMGGMFLEAELPSLSRGEEVSVSFSLPSEEGGRTHSLTAKVARVSSDGVGLAFLKPDTATFRTLQELLKYSKSQNLH